MLTPLVKTSAKEYCHLFMTLQIDLTRANTTQINGEFAQLIMTISLNIIAEPLSCTFCSRIYTHPYYMTVISRFQLWLNVHKISYRQLSQRETPPNTDPVFS